MPTNISGSTASTILGCNVCIAEGGVLTPQDQVGCVSTLDDIEVNFGAFTPDPSTFGYTMVVTDAGGNVTQEFPFQTSLSAALLGPGTYTVCGVGYEIGSGEPASFVGQNINTLRTDLAGPMPPFCGDASDNCADITIRPEPIPTFLVDSVCLGAEEPNCPFINGEFICNPGAGSFTVETQFGCDSLVSYLITPSNGVFTNDSLLLCPGQAYEFDGTDYFAPALVSVQLPAGSNGGCDTTLFLQLIEDPLFAVVSPAAFTLDCQNQSIILESTGSSTGSDITYLWTQGSTFISTGPTITVTSEGTYTLEVIRTNPLNGETCSVTADAIIVQAAGESGAPSFTGDQQLCVDQAGDYAAQFLGNFSPYNFDFVITGPSTIVTQSQGDLSVSWSAAGTYEVCVSAVGSCGPTDTTCISVVIEPSGSANAGQDQQLCGFNTSVTGTPGGGSWTAITGPDGTGIIDSPTTASTTVSAGAAGTYAFVYGLPGNCSTADTVEVTFGPDLSASTPTAICDQATLQYTVSFDLTGGTPPFIVTGTPGGLTGRTFVSNPLASGSPYDILIVDALGCIIQLAGTENCNCTTDAGSMSTAQVQVCVPNDITATPVTGSVNDGDDLGTYVLHTNAGAGLGTVLQTSANGIFSFAPPLVANTVYYVSFVIGNDNGAGQPDLSDPCYAVTQGQPVQWVAPEMADAGGDLSSCGLSLVLAADNSSGTWSGPAGVAFSDPTDPTAIVTAGGPGTYALTWTTGIAGCTDSDETEVTFFPQPTATTVEDCPPGAALYTLTITASGGTAPYTVNGLAVSGTGSTFTAQFPSGLPYNFTLTDANGCESLVITGVYTCNCSTEAPQLASGASACVGEPITLTLPTGGVNDGDDADRFILYSGDANAVANVLDQSATPTFPYNPAYTPGQVYYIAVERATNDGAGGIDPDDPCYDRSAGVPVSWDPLPTITLSSVTICEGDDALVPFTYRGNLPAQITVQVNGVGTTFDITSPSGTLTLPGADAFITVSSLSEAGGCVNSAPTAAAQITVQTQQQPQVSGGQSLCNSNASGDATMLNTSDLLISGGAGTWSSPDAPAALVGATFDADGLLPGVYTLVFTTTPVGNCQSTSATVEITVRDCACPNLTLLAPGVLCNDNAFFDLNSLLEEAQVGVWSISAGPTGSMPAQLDGSMFDGTSADAGTYRVLFTLTQGNVAGCPDTNSVAIRLAGQVFAGSSTGDLQFCESSIDIVDLSTQLVGQDPGGAWSALGGGSSALQANILDISQLTVGSYTFEYLVAAPAPCNPARASVVVDILAAPTAEAGEDQLLTCVDREATLGGPATPGLDYAWRSSSSTGVISTESSFIATVTDLYELTVTNPATGCIAVDEVEVVSSDDVPIVAVDIQPVSCNGEQDAAISITSIEGGVGPYRVLINGESVGLERTFFELGPGAYEIEVSDQNGCTADPLSFDITEPEVLDVDILTNLGGTGAGSGTIQFRDTVLLEAFVSSDTADVLWTPSEFVACDTCASTYGLPPSTLVYSVSVTTPEGCTDGASVQVIVQRDRPIYFPTGFSPNGDGTNDWFFPQASEGMVRTIRSFIIHDRWGEKVFERYGFDANEPMLGWNGALGGEPMNPAVFAFIAEVEFADGVVELIEGDISLIR